MFWIFLESPQWGDSKKYPKHMFYEEIRTKPDLLHIYLLIRYSVQQQIHLNGNVFGNKWCRCNEGSLYLFSTYMAAFSVVTDFFICIGTSETDN